ncbi:unnamed protein product [Cladocopium goreaui]|uniref:DeSI-like protein n=1 Tax=Cladocopium goreaui TaxID=2562237 RepID=A0A9P1G919_9DINO|nr:unnamed protein product [Cladocopium goreaui]|mmetsp:Transcript_48155/g.105006  ORF Transcript_48155/g.105006 Transcript_48155/m.105006 type:complete len:376 (+) Transcript_48155:70-1197(+)
MVVAQIVKLRNNTLRTFHITPGDFFYKTSVDGQPLADESIEVSPGFDQTTDGLTVPWESVSGSGLEISESKSGSILRCVVGPCDSDSEDRDWLQFRSADWEPIEEQKWIQLGPRHLLGTVGASVDLALTFRDAKSGSSDLPFSVVQVVHFENAMKTASPNTVFLNIFDLASALSIPNSMLCNTMFNTLGAFHAAIEVYGQEWAFYRTPNPTSCGVCRSLRPRHHPVHVYRQSINLGDTHLKEWEVRYLIRGKLAANWPGGTYDLLRHNCIHFCSELALALGVSPVPAWVRNLHETGAGVFQIPWPLSALHSTVFGDRKAIGCEGDSVDEQQDLTSLRGGTEVTFTSATSAAPALPHHTDLVVHWRAQGGATSASC